VRKRLAAAILIMILTMPLLPPIKLARAATSDPWSPAYGDWQYRTAVTISNPNSADLADFQVKVVLDSNWPGWSHVKEDGGDIRFATADGTAIPYWVESWDYTNNHAEIWIKVPSIPASGSTTVYLYYGNPSAESESNGEAVFEFFDDFTADTGKWTLIGSNSEKNYEIGQTFTKVGESPDTDSHQGVAASADYYYTFHTNRIDKRSKGDWSVVLQNTNPFEGMVGVDHVGDGDYYDGKLYVPVEHWASTTDYGNQYIAVYDADTLQLLEAHDISQYGHEVASLVVVPEDNAIYVVDYSDTGAKVYKYSLTNFALQDTITLSQAIKYAQGIEYKDGLFYISAEDGKLYVVQKDGTVIASYALVSASYNNEGLAWDGNKLLWTQDEGNLETVFIFETNEESLLHLPTLGSNVGGLDEGVYASVAIGENTVIETKMKIYKSISRGATGIYLTDVDMPDYSPEYDSFLVFGATDNGKFGIADWRFDTDDIIEYNEFTADYDTWHVWTIKKNGNTYTLYYDGEEKGSITRTTQPKDYLVFGVPYNNNELWVDWVRVRKYAEQEPTVSVMTEEINPNSYTITLNLKDDAGVSLSGVTVTIKDSSGNTVASGTYADGDTLVLTNEDTYTIRAEKAGYVPDETSVTVVNGTSTYTVALTLVDIPEPSISVSPSSPKAGQTITITISAPSKDSLTWKYKYMLEDNEGALLQDWTVDDDGVVSYTLPSDLEGKQLIIRAKTIYTDLATQTQWESGESSTTVSIGEGTPTTTTSTLEQQPSNAVVIPSGIYKVELYATEMNEYLSGGSTLEVNSTIPYQLGENFWMALHLDAGLALSGTVEVKFVFDTDTVDFLLTYDNSTSTCKIWVDGMLIGTEPSLSGLRLVVWRLGSTIKAGYERWEGVILKGSGSASISLSPNHLEKIIIITTVDATTYVSNFKFGRYSDHISGLTVYDEETLEPILPDFVELANGVRVLDPYGVYLSRDYYASGYLYAYLPRRDKGHYYLARASSDYGGKFLLFYRNYGGNWILVGETLLDNNGEASIFLIDGVMYTFAISDGHNILLETSATADPNMPYIDLLGLDKIIMIRDVSADFAWSVAPLDGFLYNGTTTNVTIRVSSETTISSLEVTIAGAGVSYNATYYINSLSAVIPIQVTPSEAYKYVHVHCVANLTDGTVKEFTRTFYVKPEYVDKGGLLQTLRDIDNELGLSPLARLIVATIVTLLAAGAASSYSGGKGSVVAAIFSWMFFTYLGWIDWRITLITGLAGVGMLVRRGEV